MWAYLEDVAYEICELPIEAICWMSRGSSGYQNGQRFDQHHHHQLQQQQGREMDTERNTDGWLIVGSHCKLAFTLTNIYRSVHGAEKPVTHGVVQYTVPAHNNAIKFLRWNEPYNMIATCSSDSVKIWRKTGDIGFLPVKMFYWMQEVADFAWSVSGQVSVACYKDRRNTVRVSQVNWNGTAILDRLHTALRPHIESTTELLSDTPLLTCCTFSLDERYIFLGTDTGQVLQCSVVPNQAVHIRVRLISCLEIVRIGLCSTSCHTTSGGDSGVLPHNNKSSQQHSPSDKQDERTATSLATTSALVVSDREKLLVLHDVACGEGNYCTLNSTTTTTQIRPCFVHFCWIWAERLRQILVGGVDSDGLVKVKFYGADGACRSTIRMPPFRVDSEWLAPLHGSVLPIPVTGMALAYDDTCLFLAHGWLVRVLHLTPSDAPNVCPLHAMCSLTIKRTLREESAVHGLPLPIALRHAIAALFAQTINSNKVHRTKL